MQSIKIRSPCSSANLGSGFDSFGLALEAFYDTVTLEPTDGEIKIEVTGIGAERIPKSPNKNTAGLVAKRLLENKDVGVKIHLHKGIPLGMGLGSSGASAAACAYGLNELLNLGLSRNEIVRWAALGEIAAAGAAHADNVAASILGGFTIVRTCNDLIDVVRLNPPPNLQIALAMPIIKISENKTATARSILPRSIPLKSAILNIQNAAYIVAGFHLGNIEMIGRGMMDVIAEPFRKKLIPCYKDVKKAALDAGAAGVAISGAGPTVIAVVDSTKISAGDVAEAMAEAFRDGGVECRAYCSKPSLKGTERIVNG